MRAFMSTNRVASIGQTLIEIADITRCTVFAPSGGSCERAATTAEREARRILAETEPPTPYTRHDRSRRGLATDALADALRAFVEGD